MKVPFLIPPGIISDDTTFASEGRWVDGNNVRFWRGTAETIGGWSIATNGLSGVCRNVLPWTQNDGTGVIAFGTHTKLYAYTGGAVADITPSSGFTAGQEHGAGGPGYGAGAYGAGTYGGSSASDYFPLTWSFGNWGQNLLACPRGQTIFRWANNTGTPAAAIANAPDNVTYMIMTPERQILALGCNEEVSGTYNPLCIRGCKSEDYDDWTTNSNDNVFEHILTGSGRIVAGGMVGQYVAVWTDNSLYIGEYVGLPDQAYRFDPVETNCGLVGPNAFLIINQTAYWITPDYQFYAWAPGSPPKLIQCPIRNDFKDNITPSQFDKIAATGIGQYGEVWWFYPDARDGLECSRYVALSTIDGTWFRGQLERSACCDAGPTQAPVFVTPDGTAYWHETGRTADGAALEWSLTSADQYIDDARRFLVIRGIWPDFEDQQGAVSMELNLRKWPQANTVYTKGPYSLPVNVDKKDFMASGRVASVTFSGNSSPAFARFGKPTWDVEVAGEF